MTMKNIYNAKKEILDKFWENPYVKPGVPTSKDFVTLVSENSRGIVIPINNFANNNYMYYPLQEK